jgi:hypothetical protein
MFRSRLSSKVIIERSHLGAD